MRSFLKLPVFLVCLTDNEGTEKEMSWHWYHGVRNVAVYLKKQDLEQRCGISGPWVDDKLEFLLSAWNRTICL